MVIDQLKDGIIMKTWSDVEKVQHVASKLLMNSIRKQRVSHAYLIHGQPGTGKRDIALLLAKSLFCQNRTDVEPCHTCNACRRIESRNHPDVHWIIPDGQSIKIDQIEQLQKEFIYTGLESNQKVYIICQAETLTVNAANRILKFLEEPSQRTTAMLLTENHQAMIPTIRSRCQVIDLKPLNQLQFRDLLISKGLSDSNARLMSVITNHIDEAIELAEDEWFRQARSLVLQLIDIYLSESRDIFLFIHQYWIPHFKEKDQIERGLDLLLLAFKDILYFHLNQEHLLAIYSPGDARLEKAALYFSPEKLLTILNDVLDAKQKVNHNVHSTLVIEQLALQI